MLQLTLHFIDEPKHSKDKQSKKNVSVSCPRLEKKQLFTNERIHDAPQLCMSGKNRRLVTDEPVEFEGKSVEVGDFRRITDHFRGIYRMHLK
jgi:hypothetical protein